MSSFFFSSQPAAGCWLAVVLCPSLPYLPDEYIRRWTCRIVFFFFFSFVRPPPLLSYAPDFVPTFLCPFPLTPY
ncbi:hypothetical protein BKA57DRAFT_37039 [Linnemannia elongata]|nr:hypothetical protein BKA57DRAFT_37039 [Linnemannia elongata]